MADPKPPHKNVRRLLSIWLPLHLLALLVSFSAVVEPSAIQNRVLNFIRPYLQVTHFGADDRPLYLAHGDASEQPHRLQQSSVAINSIESAESEQRWTTIEPDGRPGLAGSDRYARWLATAASLSENEEPGLVAELLLPIVQADESIRAIRIRRLPNELNEESFPYSARVIRDPSGVSLVQLQWTRLSAVASETEDQSDD